MHTQTLSRPVGAPPRFHAPVPFRAKAAFSTSNPKPESKGLTRAQLREIIIEQLG